VFLVQLSVFILLVKKVYFKKYKNWLLGIKQTLNPIIGILIILIPIGIYVVYFNIFTGEFNEYSSETLLLFAAFFFIGALTEELIFRGYFYKMLIMKNRKYAIYIILFQAFIFTAVHFNNPGHTYLRIAIIFIAGVLLGIIALQGFIYAVIFHFFWNFFQAYLLGINVSGYIFTGSIFTYPTAPAWENNIYTGIFLGLVTMMIFILYLRNRKQFI